MDRCIILSPKGGRKCTFFFNMTRRFKAVTFDNRRKNAFLVTQRDDDSVIGFVPSTEGLYYRVLKERKNKYKKQ